MTFLQIVNKVLIKLRETQVTGYDDTTYSSLIAEFVNETKEEVENAWDWQGLRTTLDETTSAGTSQYAVTGAGKRFRVLDEDDYAVFNATNKYPLKPANARWVKQQLKYSDNAQSYPLVYYFEGFDSNGDPYINFYPVPDGSYDIDIELVVPQAELAANTTELTVPSRPVILGAYAKAVYERGEDGGDGYTAAQGAYMSSLSDAIALDNVNMAGEDTWYE